MGLVSRNLLITLVLSLAAIGVGAWAGARIFGREPDPPSLHEFVHEELDLSAGQDAQLETLERDFAVRRKAREAELRAANAALAAAIQSGHTYSPEVQAAVERFHHTMGELQKETILHVLEMRKILTPAQAARYDQRISQALTEETL
ncbi:MAG: periplasmic heavy metal sensor [Phenylobacterium sp.]|uniref:Spy/CpxP family protein refolding chaperone n=1 Tax=Phenylobacterium sp. TaxID=1871053 RepID=UPI001A4D0469|nr:periplasmic heavy metal sensor [Phenylobacterium sp.]MBL8556562.1 periplasmic heavy metal sensor [Phenylobacterium sp.]